MLERSVQFCSGTTSPPGAALAFAPLVSTRQFGPVAEGDGVADAVGVAAAFEAEAEAEGDAEAEAVGAAEDAAARGATACVAVGFGVAAGVVASAAGALVGVAVDGVAVGVGLWPPGLKMPSRMSPISPRACASAVAEGDAAAGAWTAATAFGFAAVAVDVGTGSFTVAEEVGDGVAVGPFVAVGAEVCGTEVAVAGCVGCTAISLLGTGVSASTVSGALAQALPAWVSATAGVVGV
ncbi:hypothetical protein KNE206_77490 [Kitasatospora sp. NE20-6]